jgi:hypothetical protein
MHPNLELRILVEEPQYVQKRIMTLIRGIKDDAHGGKLTRLRFEKAKEGLFFLLLFICAYKAWVI